MEDKVIDHKLIRSVLASVLIAGTMPALRGLGQTCSQRIARPSQGVGIDTNGNVWVSGKLNYTLYRYSPDGQTVDAFDISQWGAYGAYGVAVTPVDNDVWVAIYGFEIWDITPIQPGLDSMENDYEIVVALAAMLYLRREVTWGCIAPRRYRQDSAGARSG